MAPFRIFIVLGAINGFLAVAFGAFAAHGLKSILSPGLLAIFQTGVDYQATHAIALILVGMLSRSGSAPLLKISGWAFATGIVIFSGSLFLLALSDARWLGAITPIGGAAFLVGWATLAWHFIRTP